MINLSKEATSLINDSSYQTFVNTKDVNNLKVDKKTHQLVKCSFKDKITFLSSKKRAKRDAEVKQKIQALVAKIENLPELKTKSFFKYPQLQNRLQTLFFDKFAKLKSNPFLENLNKNADQSSKLRLSKTLQNYLSPELNTLRKEAKLSSTLKTDNPHTLERRVTKAKLAIKLGAGYKTNSGATGSLILTSINGKPLGVFKTSSEHIKLKVKVKNFFKWLMHGQLHYLSPRHTAQPEAEVAASKLDLYFNFNISPLSKIEEIGGKIGAFQVFLRGYQEAKEVLSEIDTKDSFTKEETHQFQMMAVYDYLIGNLDRHEENWFVKLRGKDKKSITELKCIDNANSFIKFNPNNLSKHWMVNQYKWKNLNIAKVHFNDNVKKFIHSHLSDANMKVFIAGLKSTLPDFLEADMEEHLLQRAKVLRRAASTDYYSPAKLGELTTDESINEFLDGNYGA